MYGRKFDAVQRMKSLLEKKIIRTIKIAGGAKERIEYMPVRLSIEITPA